MMGEPLKNKKEVGGTISNKFQNYMTTGEDWWFHQKNIKSAVEWLKLRITKHITLKAIDNRKDQLHDAKKLIYELIDEAFEDVTILLEKKDLK